VQGLVLLAILVAAVYFVLQAVSAQQDAADRHHPGLHQVALAVLTYTDEHESRLPPAVVYGADGRALHSWRVLVLPYLDEQELYDEFKLDEPWDSPHNLALLDRMPAAYAPPKGKVSKVPLHHTLCHVFVGKGAAFEGRIGLRYPAEFTDGTSQTILLIEAGEPVPWTKPEDLAYDPDQPLPELPSLFKTGFRVAMADASRQFLTKDIPEKTLRKAIVRNDGPEHADW
jgi:hypothetical protein